MKLRKLTEQAQSASQTRPARTHWLEALHVPHRRTAGGGTDEEAARRTDVIVGKLPQRGWTVIEDVDSKHGADHVLVGPGGVFLIISRKLDGPGVRVRDGVLWLRKGQDGRTARPGTAINRCALDAARLLDREIRAHTAHRPTVHPVVVLWCEFPQTVAESSRISFIHGRDLLRWLCGHPVVLDQAAQHEVSAAIRAFRRNGRSLASHLHLPGRAA